MISARTKAALRGVARLPASAAGEASGVGAMGRDRRDSGRGQAAASHQLLPGS